LSNLKKKLKEHFSNFSKKPNKKRVIITAAIVIILLLAIFIGIIVSIHTSSYDYSFEYTKVDNILAEVANKHTYYTAEDKSIEIQLDQDFINSLIKDNLTSMDMDLPDSFTINEVKFVTENKKIFISAKYGFLNVPISAQLNIDIVPDGVEIYANKLKIAWLGAPGFVRKQIPEESLKYSLKYKDLDVPQVFSVKNIKFSTGTVKVTVGLLEDKIAEYAVNHRKDLMDQIDIIKSQNTVMLSTFIDKLLQGDILSDKKITEYVYSALNNEELINSAIHFTVADNLDKYAKGFEETRKKVEEWAEPLNAIKYYGNIDDTVSNILYNQELKEFSAWFLPTNDIEEYTDVADKYYTKFKDARSAVEGLGENFESGDWETALDNVLYNNEVKEFLSLFALEEDVNEYFGKADDIYSKIKKGRSTLEIAFASLDEGDYGYAIDKIAHDRELKALFSLFMSETQIKDLTGKVSDLSVSLDEAADFIDTDLTNEFADLLIEMAEDLKDDKKYLLDIVGTTNPQEIRQLVEYLEKDKGFAGKFISDVDPTLYKDFKAELKNLEEYKSNSYEFLKDADFSQMDEYIKAIEEIKDLAVTLKQNSKP